MGMYKRYASMVIGLIFDSGETYEMKLSETSLNRCVGDDRTFSGVKKECIFRVEEKKKPGKKTR